MQEMLEDVHGSSNKLRMPLLRWSMVKCQKDGDCASAAKNGMKWI